MGVAVSAIEAKLAVAIAIVGARVYQTWTQVRAKIRRLSTPDGFQESPLRVLWVPHDASIGATGQPHQW